MRHLPEEQFDFWSILFFLEALVILVGNVVTLRIFLKQKFLINKSCFLLVNLTIADLLVGLSSTVLWFIRGDRYGGDVNRLIFQISLLIPIASLSSLAIISIERAVAVFMPFRHRVADNRHYFVAVGLSWVFIVVPLILVPLVKHKKSNDAVNFSVILFLLIILTACYLSIYIKMKFFPIIEQSRNSQNQFKLSKTLFLTTVVSVMAWFPFATVQCYISFCDYACRKDIPVICFKLTLVAQLSNSFLNLIVYSFRLPEFRKELKASFCRCSRRHYVHPSTRGDAFCLGTRVPRTDEQV